MQYRCSCASRSTRPRSSSRSLTSPCDRCGSRFRCERCCRTSASSRSERSSTSTTRLPPGRLDFTFRSITHMYMQLCSEKHLSHLVLGQTPPDVITAVLHFPVHPQNEHPAPQTRRQPAGRSHQPKGFNTDLDSGLYLTCTLAFA